MYGIYVDGRRPQSKKEIKAAVKTDPARVYIEDTSLFRQGYDGPVNEMPNQVFGFVGPDPRTSRKFYGNIRRNGNRFVVE